MRHPPSLCASPDRRRGFVLIMALAIIGILAITLGVIAASLTMESRRTNLQADEAQIRQLLAAGEEIARSRLDRGNPVDAAVNLPKSLADEGAALKLSMGSAGETVQTIEISGTIGKHRGFQTVRFERRDGAWLLADAKLH